MVLINNRNIKTWGATIQTGSLGSLLQRGEQKPYTENEFESISGKEVLPKNPRQSARTFSIDISIQGKTRIEFLRRYDRFFYELSKGVVSLGLVRLGLTFKLVYKQSQMYMTEYSPNFANFKVTFEEVNPADRKTAPVEVEVKPILVTEDGKVIVTENNTALWTKPK